MKIDSNLTLIPNNENEIKTIKEEVYKSALEVIKSLCDSYSVTTSDIKAICETVLKEGEKNK